jgi:cyclohexanecarboxylate-CoA ligase
MVGAPTFLRDLTEGAGSTRHDLSSLRLFSSGGANVSAELVRSARAALGCVAKRVYGSTEFPTLTTTDARDAASMGTETEGRPIAPAEVRITAADGTIVPVGEEGEVQARGPECFVGYLDRALDAEAFSSDGWFRTGDLGRLDDDGYLRITGRLKEIIIRKGEKISVRELEELIGRHPSVAAVCVIAVPDDTTGERACAAVVARPGAAPQLEDLTRFLRGQGLAPQKLPEELVVLPELPYTDSGKVHRAALRQRLIGKRGTGRK